MKITTTPHPDNKAAEMTIHILNRANGETTGQESEKGVMHFLLQLHGSVDKAMATVRKARPDNNPQFIAFPGVRSAADIIMP